MGHDETILLVDDARSDALLYSALLRRTPGTSRAVDHAPSLEAAMRMLEDSRYAAVMLDLGLPDSEELQGVERIVERHPEVPVVVLTGRDDRNIGERAIAAGARDYLHKGDARLDTIDRVLRHAQARQRLENQTREALQELRALFDHNPMPVFVYDEQTLGFVTANAAALDFYGYAREEFLRLAVTDIGAGEERDRFLRALQEPWEQPGRSDWRHRTRDGRAVTVQVHSERLRLQARDCRIVIVQDVTAQRSAQRRMAESERRFRDVFELSLGYICTHDPDGILLSVNPAAAEALGRSRERMVGRSLADFMPERGQDHLSRYLKRIFERGEDHGVLPTVHHSGEVRLWRYHNRLVERGEDGPVVLGIAHDVTERQRMEQQLLDKTAELEAVNDAAPLGLFRTDARGHCLYVNRTWERLAGLSQEQALGQGWKQALHPQDRAEVEQEWAQVIAGHKRRLSGEQRFVHADGRVVRCKLHASPMVIDGAISGYFGTAQDITREHEAETARRRGDQRLATLADALPLLLMFLDRDLRVEFINSGWTRELRRPPEKILGQPVLELLNEPAASHVARGLAIARDGTEHNINFDDPDETAVRTWNAVFIPQRDQAGQVDGVHVMLRDVTLEKAHRQELVRRAEQDPLTGILNRAGFQVRGGHAWSKAARQGRALGMFFFDLDGFKEINDTLGHAAGDGLLREVSARVDEDLRSGDILARMGGDEFAVIVDHVASGDTAQRVADRLIETVRSAVHRLSPEPGAGTLRASCSLGYCVADTAQVSMDEALGRADAALYAAKRAGKGQAMRWSG